MRKDFKEEVMVGKFVLAAENCLRFRGEQTVFRDNFNKLEAKIYCERIDGKMGYRDTSVSDRSSVGGSIDGRVGQL